MFYNKQLSKYLHISLALVSSLLLAILVLGTVSNVQAQGGNLPPDQLPCLRTVVNENYTSYYQCHFQGNRQTAPESALSFLTNYADALQIANPAQDLKLIEVKHGLASSHTRYQQIFKQYPVYNGNVSVHQGKDSQVHTVHTSYTPNLVVQARSGAQLSQSAAETTGRSAANVSRVRQPSTGELVWYRVTNTEVVLAWQMMIFAEEPLGDFLTLVDAHTGDVLFQENRIVFDTGSGFAYIPNPYQTQGDGTDMVDNNDATNVALDAQRITATLQGLDSGTGLLIGEYVDLATLNSTSLPDIDANEPDRQYFYDRDDERFEQVVIYHSIDSIQRYFQALGFSDSNPIPNGIRDYPTLANAHWYSDDQSFYSTGDDAVHFGDGGVDDGEDADIVAHEYGHAVQHNQNASWGGGEMGAMGEGFGDYLAASFYINDGDPAFQADHAPCVGEWDATSYSGTNPPCLRRVDGTKIYPDDLTGGVHADGEIWSRAVWDIRLAIGSVADQIILEHHFALPGSATMPTAALGYLQADVDITGGANDAAIRFAFCERGILTGEDCIPADLGILQGTIRDMGTTNPISGAVVTADAYNATTDVNGFYQITILSGTYTVEASAYGYASDSVSNVTIVKDMTTTVDISLTNVSSYVVNGTVTDATTGWPLYAKINISGDPVDPPPPFDTIWSDPVTGFYSLTLASDITYTFEVMPWVTGYETGGGEVGPLTTDTLADFTVVADAITCNAPGYTGGQTLLVSEDFESWPLPAGWNIVNNGGDCTWDAGSNDNEANETGGSGDYADADSDNCGSGNSMDTDLQTPVLDFSGYAAGQIGFKSDMRFYQGDIWDVDLSLDSGSSWSTNLLHRENQSFRGPETITLNMPSVAGDNDARLRFRYQGGYDYWWQVDEVQVYGISACLPTEGGLIVGNVYDNASNLAVNGATIAHTGGISTTSMDTPEDDGVDDGFYTLFAPVGTHLYIADHPSYGQDNYLITTVVSDTIEQDFYLAQNSIVLTKTVGLDPASCATTDQIEVLAGTEVAYCYQVQNTGPMTLTLHDLEDDMLGTLLNSQVYTLTPESTFWLTTTTIITQDTLNTAIWTAYNAGPVDMVMASDFASVNIVQPEISLSKTVGTDPASCASSNTLSVVSGSEVTYCYTVTNSGDIPFTNHDLWDDQLGIILSNVAYTLNPSESYWLTQTVSITQDTVNMAMWTASEMTFTTEATATAWATVTVTLPTPEISLTKTVGTNPANCASSNTVSVVSGSEVTYCYTVTNSGNIPLTNHDLWDDQLGMILTDTTYTLNPGESYWLTQTVTIITDTVNMAIWTASEMTNTTEVTATAWATVTTVSTPIYGVQVIAPVSAMSGTAGSSVTYTVWVTNTGDVIDSYTLSSNGIWTNNTSADVTDLPAGSSAIVALWVTIPATVTNGQMDETTVTATSVSEGSATASQSVTTTAIVEETNNVPVAVDDTATTEAETALVIAVLDNDSDPDGDTITVTIVSDPANGSATITDTGILYSPEANFSGTDTFSYTITDGALTDSALVTVTVNEVVSNTYGVQVVAPVSALSGTAGSSVTYTVWVTNTGSSTDTFEVSGTGLGTASLPATVGPLAAGVGQSLNVVVAIPATASNGQQYLTEVVATSQGDNTQSDSVTLTTTAIVEETNQAPEAVDDTATTEAETALVIAVLDNDSDPDGDVIIVSMVSDPANGSAIITDTGILYSPDVNFSGTDTFSYTITDGELTDTALVTVTVNEVVSVTYGVQVVAPVSAMTGTASSSITYTVWLTNTGSGTDTFDLSGTGLGTANLPATVGPLAAGVGQSLNVVVAIPGTASNGQQYLTEVVATSQGDNTQSDSVTLTTTAVVEESSFILYLPLVLK